MLNSVRLQVSIVFPVRVEEAWQSVTRGDLTRASQSYGPIPGVVAIRDEPPRFFEQPGQRRTLVNSDGSTAIETIISLDPPYRFEYTITELTNAFRHLTSGAKAAFAFDAFGDHETSVTWRYAWHARSAAALPVVWLVARLAFGPYMARMLRGFREEASSL